MDKKKEQKIVNSNKEWDHRDKTKPKFSVGIALYRFNHKKHTTEVLFVKKRCTYWYTTFVLGRYNVKDDKRLLYMLSRMTPEEKLVILTMNFRIIWDHNWQTHNYNPKFVRKPLIQPDSYESREFKFKDLIKDHGNHLRLLISQSKNRPLIWEIPKGRKINNAENDVECAVREFREETNIIKEQYMFVPINPMTYSHRDGDVNYMNKYYFATPTGPIRCRINFDMLDQISEIIDVKWMTEQEAILMNCAHTNFVHRLFLSCKKIRPILNIPEPKLSELSFYEDTPLSITNDTKNE